MLFRKKRLKTPPVEALARFLLRHGGFYWDFSAEDAAPAMLDNRAEIIELVSVDAPADAN